jgi:hypothetical protein
MNEGMDSFENPNSGRLRQHPSVLRKRQPLLWLVEHLLISTGGSWRLSRGSLSCHVELFLSLQSLHANSALCWAPVQSWGLW